MEQGGRSEIRLGVPPVARAGCATAGAQNALIHPIQLFAVLLALQDLLPLHRRRVLPLEPGLDALILVVEVGHVHDQVLDHEHVRQRRYGGGRRGGRNLSETSKAVAAVNVHRTGAADPLTAGAAEGEGGVDLVLDLDERVQDHGPALLQVDLVVLQLRLRWVLRVPPVDLERLQGGRVPGLRLHLLGLGLRRMGPDECQLKRRRGGHPLRRSLQQPRRRHRNEKVGVK